GAGLKDYVRGILNRLVKRTVDPDKCPGVDNLRDAFLSLCIPHAANIRSLHREALAAALCESLWEESPRRAVDVLKNQVLGRLGWEAATEGGDVVLTRHRAIAEAAVELTYGAAALAE